jgi:general secretion pathway protein D
MGWKRPVRTLLVCVLAGTLLPALPPLSAPAFADDPQAAKLAQRARKQAAKGDYAGAWILAEQAVARQSRDPSLRALADAYQHRGLQALSASTVLRPLPDARGADPVLSESELAERTLSEINAEDRRDLAGPPELKPDRGRHSFELRADPRTLIERVASAYGITPVFDSDFPATEAVQKLRLDEASWSEAIYALELITNSFYVPVSTRVALFAKETAVKRGEIEPNVAVAIPFPETMSAQELQDVANAIRQAFALTKVAMDSNQHAMVLRDRVSRVRPAMEVARQLLSGPAEVYVDVELFSVASSSDLSRGLDLQTSYPIVAFGGPPGFTLTPPAVPSGINAFLTLGGGSTAIGVGISDVTLLAALTGQMATEVARSALRSVSGQQATLHIGDRYPIIQQEWGSGTAPPSTGYATMPSITFEDLGIVVKLTPRVHDASSLTLDFDAEYKVLSGSTSDNIPIISNRKFTVQVRLKFGESVLIAGLVQDVVSKTDSGIPGLTWIPMLHMHTESRQNQRFLLVLRPTLLRLPPSEFPSYGVWSGTEVRGLPFEFKDRAAEQRAGGLP